MSLQQDPSTSRRYLLLLLDSTDMNLWRLEEAQEVFLLFCTDEVMSVSTSITFLPFHLSVLYSPNTVLFRRRVNIIQIY